MHSFHRVPSWRSLFLVTLFLFIAFGASAGRPGGSSAEHVVHPWPKLNPHVRQEQRRQEALARGDHPSLPFSGAGEQSVPPPGGGAGGGGGFAPPGDLGCDAIHVARGNQHTLIVRSDHSVWSWGDNVAGQLGNGESGPGRRETTPVQVLGAGGSGFLGSAVAVAGGYQHSLALLADGTVWSWGDNVLGQLGNGITGGLEETPVQVLTGVGPLADIIAIEAGAFHSLALDANGVVWAWGDNSTSQLANPTVTDSNVAITVKDPIVTTDPLDGIAAIASGSYHVLARTETDFLYAWGWNVDGQLGNGTTTDAELPVFVRDPDNGIEPFLNVVLIAAGERHSLAVRGDCTTWAWGSDATGQLGDGGPLAGPDQLLPIEVLDAAATEPLACATAIAAGEGHSLAVRSDDTVWAWGSDTLEQLGNGGLSSSSSPTRVLGEDGVGFLDDVVLLATGSTSDHSAALQRDGTVLDWGSNSSGQLGVGSFSHSDVPVEPFLDCQTCGHRVIETSGGALHSLALLSDGSVWAWGDNRDGQLGIGVLGGPYNGGGYELPVQVVGPGGIGVLSDVVAIAAGGEHSLAVTSDGQVWSWGENGDGQLGLGTVGGAFTTPQELTAIPNGVKISAGWKHSACIDVSRKVWSWGANDFGQVGSGSSALDVPTPEQVLFYGDQIDLGTWHSVAVTDVFGARRAWSWGDNRYGQLGIGSYDGPFEHPTYGMVAHDSPQLVQDEGCTGSLTEVKQAVAGERHSAAIRTDCRVLAWGANDRGQLGDGTGGSVVSTPCAVQVSGLNGVGLLDGVAELDAGSAHVLARNLDGTVFAWGWKYQGQLGDGAPVGDINDYSDEPVQVIDPDDPTGVMRDVVDIAAGSAHSLAVQRSRVLRSWGLDTYGQLGDDDRHLLEGATSTPVEVLLISGFVDVAGGDGHSVAVTAVGSVYTWGDSEFGQLGDGTIGPGAGSETPVRVPMIEGVAEVDAGWFHVLALDGDGVLRAWGNNEEGQLGDTTTTDRSEPVPVDTSTGLGRVVAFAAGGFHSLALDDANQLWTWGWNEYGQLGNGTSGPGTGSSAPVMVSQPAGVTFVAVAAGWAHSLALASDGHVWSWGYNGDGQLGIGTFGGFETTPLEVLGTSGSGVLTAVSSIAAGDAHSLALRTTTHVTSWGWNDAGQLGDDTRTDRSFPVFVIDPFDRDLTWRDAAVLAGGGAHTLAIKVDSTTWSWGENADGQLGLEFFGSFRKRPQRVAPSTGGLVAAAIDAGVAHSLASDSSCRARGWGWNAFGQVGDGTTDSRNEPTPLCFEGCP